MIRQPGVSHRTEFAAQAAIFTLATVLLFWHIAERYLWQDEAATAVLAVRMLKFGKPLAYDGKNLVTIDMEDDQEDAELSRRTREPQPAIDYFVEQRNFGKDLLWKWQPWGLFALAAVSIKLLGQTTLGARLPFVLAGLATVPLLYRLARRQFDSFPIAALSALILVSNSYWILHARQCRYYPVSSLFLVLTLLGYARWQWGGHNEAWFIVSAWCWFQVDYGTVLPVVAVLFLEAFLAHPRAFWRNARAGAILAASLAWFVYFYDLLHRGSDTDTTWRDLFLQNLFNTNEFVVPVLVVLAAVAVLLWKRKSLPEGERRLVTVGCLVILAITIWIPTVAVSAFVRYVIITAPVGAMLTAWVFVRLFPVNFAWLAAAPAAVAIFTPWLGLPLRPLAPPPDRWSGSKLYRTELKDLRAEIFLRWPDPNRLVIDWLRRNATPTDEILINYEDFPLMYYLPNPIRGGIATFRVEDDSSVPPRFVIFRRSADFVHWPVFERELARYKWEVVPLKAPDVMWGNNPDPMGDDDPNAAPNLYIARRVN